MNLQESNQHIRFQPAELTFAGQEDEGSVYRIMEQAHQRELGEAQVQHITAKAAEARGNSASRAQFAEGTTQAVIIRGQSMRAEYETKLTVGVLLLRDEGAQWR